jgi:hypothetical protein
MSLYSTSQTFIPERGGYEGHPADEDVRVGRCPQRAVEGKPCCDEGAGISYDMCVILPACCLSAQVLAH